MSRHTIAAVVALGSLACYGPYREPSLPPPPLATLPPVRLSPSGVTLQDQVSGTTARLQAISAVNDQIVWASGTGGTFVVTTNGGLSWRAGTVAGADSLEFRDVHGVDARTAWLLAAGPGIKSRIYRTTDGGQNWQIQFINRTPEAFYDCFAFWDQKNGIAWSDNVGGRFPYLVTADTGQTWEQRYLDGATEGEGAFAASGTCVIALGRQMAWVATGAGKEARLFSTVDRGKSWTHVSTPIVQGSSTTGHTSIAFRSPQDGIAVGGDIAVADSWTDNVVVTHDGGLTWKLGTRPTFAGAVFGAVTVPGTQPRFVAVGPKGAAVTTDDGTTWQALDTLSYWSADFATPQAGWLVGPQGRITQVKF